LLDDVIRFSLKDIFSIIKFDHAEAYTIKITRDAELDIDNDVSKSLVEKISISLKKREQGRPVKLAYDREMPEEMLHYIVKQLKMKNQNVVPGGRYHNFKDFINFPGMGDPRLQYPDNPPLNLNELDENISKFKILRKKDILLSYPYQSYLHVIDLLREASIDPKVESINITLYRVAKNSNIVRILLNALKNGKEVTAVVELKARFDEEANIYWANQLQEEGAHVIYVVSDLKVHAKLFLIKRRENLKHLYYAHIGTGNFNESTAKIYSDHSLLTTDPRITNELIKLFNFYATNYKVNSYKHLLVAPFFMRKNFVKMICTEITNAKAGKEAYMILKMNSLVDKVMIEKLYEASKAGVKIKLIIRGICSLVTGIAGVSDNIEVISIVDRYLEHARVFIFCNGGEERYYISSADWMTRNLSFRSEVAVPIYDKGIQKQLRDIINLQLKDNTKARLINRRQTNPYKPAGKNKIRAQEAIYNYLSSLNTEPPIVVEDKGGDDLSKKALPPTKAEGIIKKPRIVRLLQPKDESQQS
jgi:polyphosphate kinase